MRAPGVTLPGTSTRSLVESLDVFPTLAQLCGVHFPSELPGRSFTSVLADGETRHRDAALSYWRRGLRLATSLRTDRYRLVGWSDPLRNRGGGLELYDLEPEPGAHSVVGERENISYGREALVDALVDEHLRP